VGVAVRPERIRIDQPGTAPVGRHELDGKVTRATYVGNAVVYVVNVDWIELEVRASNDAPHARYGVGDPVVVTFASEHASVVEDDV
jgi:ABC-type Fe3+/spermidine/putrescine transport system ATPase subunit